MGFRHCGGSWQLVVVVRSCDESVVGCADLGQLARGCWLVQGSQHQNKQTSWTETNTHLSWEVNTDDTAS